MKKKLAHFAVHIGLAACTIAALLSMRVEFVYSVTSTSTGNVTVNATVPSASTPPQPTSQPTSGPSSPPTTLAISSAKSQPLSGSSYKFTWETNLAADSRVDWGLTLNYELGAQTSAPLVSQHSITISGLTPSTTYFAKMTSKTSNQTAVKDQIAFTTPSNDFQALSISNVTVNAQTAGQVSVSWATNKNAAGKIYWGKTLSYELGQKNGIANTQSQQFTIASLDPLTTYYFKLEASTDQETVTKVEQATTIGNPPKISAISATTPTDTKALFTWTTDVMASSELYVGTQQAGPYTTFIAVDPAKQTNHAVELTGLAPSTTYYYKIRAQGEHGTTESEVLSFVTPDNTPPTITATETFDITQSKVSVRATVSEAASLQARITKPDGTVVTDLQASQTAIEHTLTFTGLTPNTSYVIQLSARDSNNNNSQVKQVAFTTLKDTTSPPNVGNIALKIIPQPSTLTQHKWILALTWQNPPIDDLAYTAIVYSFDHVPNSPEDGTLFGRTQSEAANISVARSRNLVYPQHVYIAMFTRDTSDNFSSGALTDSALGEPEGETIMDQDGDEVLDGEDNCPLAYNPAQEDSDDNNIGDACEEGQDHAAGDSDADGIENQKDNCPDTSNPDQQDTDADGIGDACEEAVPGVPAEPTYQPPTDEGETQTPETVAKVETVEEPETFLEKIEGLLGTQDAKLGIQLSDVRFTAISHNLVLRPEENMVGVLVGYDTGVVLPKKSLSSEKQVESVTLTVGTQAYLLAESENTYSTVFIKQRGQEAAQLTVRYADASIEQIDFTFSGVLYGLISTVENGTRIPLSDVKIELLNNDGSLFNAASLGQKNPATTGNEGLFGYMVPNGRYKLRFAKENYRQETTEPFDVTNNIINRSIEMLKVPKKVIDVIDPEKPLIENIVNVTENVQEKVVYGLKIALRETIKAAENPVVEEASEKQVAPAMAAAAAVNTAAATGLPALARFGQLLFTQPLMLLSRRKRQGWGTVYDALTKNPIDLAYVRLIHADTGKVMRTKITDKDGRFTFFAEQGTYRVEATRQNYTFPTQFLNNQTNDGRYIDIYHSEVITVGASGQEIRPNIPLDPMDKPMHAEKQLKRDVLKRKAQLLGSFGGIMLSASTVAIIPTAVTASMLVGHILLLLIARRLAFPPRPNEWGVVYDARTRHALQYAIARIFDTEFNKLLDTQLTDSKGRYAFLASQRTYYVTYEKKGYEKRKSNIFDLTQAKEPKVIGEKVLLKPIPEDSMTALVQKQATPEKDTVASQKTETQESQSKPSPKETIKEEQNKRPETPQYYTPPTDPTSGGYAADGSGS